MKGLNLIMQQLNLNLMVYGNPERERLTEETDEFGYTFEEFKQRYNIPVKEYLDMDKLERGRK